MYLKYIQIINFKNLKSARFEFAKGANTIIGENVVLSSIHGVKGEEYTTVIAVSLLNGYLPYWDYIYNTSKKPLRKTETMKLLYVLCSRAKKIYTCLAKPGTRHKTAMRIHQQMN